LTQLAISLMARIKLVNQATGLRKVSHFIWVLCGDNQPWTFSAICSKQDRCRCNSSDGHCKIAFLLITIGIYAHTYRKKFGRVLGGNFNEKKLYVDHFGKCYRFSRLCTTMYFDRGEPWSIKRPDGYGIITCALVLPKVPTRNVKK